VANRILWSLVLLIAVLAVRGMLGEMVRLMQKPRMVLALTATAALIAVNWLVYIWAVNNGHVVAASLGYFLNPLVNVLLGSVVLKERLGLYQWLAVGLAAIGVGVLAASALDTLWLSLALALSFSLYGLIRKIVPVAAQQGIAAETLILTPLALAYLGWLAQQGTLVLGSDTATDVLLMLSGLATTVPLVLFAVAAKRMAYSTLGLLQYIAPSLQFLLGLFVFGEELSTGQLWSFGLIWAGLGLFTVASLRPAKTHIWAERNDAKG
jgi:chloramphenicol-sensitive protein RarD